VRIVGFMLARNEEDIVEASIRHNLRSLDALTVVDHGSDDAHPTSWPRSHARGSRSRSGATKASRCASPR